MELKLGEKTYTSLNVKARMLREAITITSKMNMDSLKVEDLDELVEFVCKIYGNKFTLDNFYDELDADLLQSTLADAIQGVVGGATDKLNTFPSK